MRFSKGRVKHVSMQVHIFQTYQRNWEETHRDRSQRLHLFPIMKGSSHISPIHMREFLSR